MLYNDEKLLKESQFKRLTSVTPSFFEKMLTIVCVYFVAAENIRAEASYQGIQKMHTNTDMPKKKTNKKPLTKEEKKENQRISTSSVLIENTIREVKIFRIIAEKYRNRRKRFGLQFNQIPAIYNLYLALL